jgi:hypothetical protein
VRHFGVKKGATSPLRPRPASTSCRVIEAGRA